MEFEKLILLLENRLRLPLPGKEAHLQMAPHPINLKRFDPNLPSNHRKSGVLLLFYPIEGLAYFPLIKRPQYPGVHGGQVALPGGKMDPEDLNVIQTALREAEEEIGVSRSTIEVLGQMSDLYIPASNFLVSPTVGFVSSVPDFVPEVKEVDRIISFSLSGFMDENIRKQTLLDLGSGIRLDTPYFAIDGEIVWGATAMILNELSRILEDHPL
ncbi:CoA pyrophosphatase [Algoriphagus confluentis]|uniref:CoA pyrophosphatase n=1 Tax=Algoriphagus confluentis TaxID=1697556 RepID=A0ABQ6PKE5_9BACT|nr:CoA pyrophosphatase [Algoriphagus confluentis]